MRQNRTSSWIVIFVGLIALTAQVASAQTDSPLSVAPASAPKPDVKSLYTKREVMIPMRDGKKLFTAIHTPKDTTKKYPILMIRTPYSCTPYGEDKFKEPLHPNGWLLEDGYIFVIQDVRGCWMSEGEFVNMRPHKKTKSGPTDIDESTDTWDTIDWLVKNVADSNGAVGMWGISYPGYYCSAGMIDAHPALKAVSPQAPVSDWFWDDFHHHGALFLPHSFHFLRAFGKARPAPTSVQSPREEIGTKDGYQFFLDMGPISQIEKDWYKGSIAFWQDIVRHPNYDAFWQAMNILPHLEKVAPAVMTVGGWFDAEDLYGPLKTYHSVETKNPGIKNTLVMGPWRHGGWAKDDGDRLGHAWFDKKNSLIYREAIERRFFGRHLKGEGQEEIGFEAACFDTGKNEWRTFSEWPPKTTAAENLFFRETGRLDFSAPTADAQGSDEFVSDPSKPVPFIEDCAPGMTVTYMTDDQRFAARRPDVLSWTTAVLDRDITLAGPMTADLWVSTTAADADWIVKVIDIFPPDAADPVGHDLPPQRKMSNYHMMVRSEVFRGRYRTSYEHPVAFVPGQPTNVKFEVLDVLHTFKKGHKIMVQVQSTWFPLVDRNPQKWVDSIYEAKADDFTKALHRVYRTPEKPSRLTIGLLPGN